MSWFRIVPEYDPRPYAEIPKVRGVFVSIVIAFLVWAFAATLLSLALFVVGNLWIYFCDGHFPKPSNSNSFYEAGLALFWVSLIIEFLAHGTAYICFLGCRTWPSLPRVILFSLFGKRFGAANSAAGRINRLNIFGY